MSHDPGKIRRFGKRIAFPLWAATLMLFGANRCCAQANLQSSMNYAPSIPVDFLGASVEYAPESTAPLRRLIPSAAEHATALPVSWTGGTERLPTEADAAAFRAAHAPPAMHSTRALQAMSLPLDAMPAGTPMPAGPVFEESTAGLQSASTPAHWASFQPNLPTGPAFTESTAALEAFDALPPPDAYVPPPSRLQLRRQARIANREFRWGFSTELLMLTEGSRPTGPPIVTDDTSGAVEISPQSLPRNVGMGPRMSLSRYRSSNTEFQVVYFGIYDWNHTAVVQDENNLSLAGDIAFATTDFLGADSMTVNLQTEIHNCEANVAQAIFSDTRKWLVGFRYINFMDRLSVRSVDSDSGTSDLYVRATNNLFGGHFGVNQEVSSLLGLTTLRLRGGMFGNLASGNTYLADFDNSFELRNVNPTANGFATVGETSFLHTLQPLDNMSITIGYNLMWIDGIARGTSQVDLTDTVDSSTVVVNGGSIFLHGASAGIDFRF